MSPEIQEWSHKSRSRINNHLFTYTPYSEDNWKHFLFVINWPRRFLTVCFLRLKNTLTYLLSRYIPIQISIKLNNKITSPHKKIKRGIFPFSLLKRWSYRMDILLFAHVLKWKSIWCHLFTGRLIQVCYNHRLPPMLFLVQSAVVSTVSSPSPYNVCFSLKCLRCITDCELSASLWIAQQ